MPYIIAVLALVILGTGYTLFEKTEDSSEAVVDISLPETTTTNTPEQVIPTDTYDDSDGRIEKEDTVQKDEDDNPSFSDLEEQANIPKPVPAPPLMPAADSNRYTDGTFYTTKSYRTPDGTYQMNVSVTVNDDKVTASSLSFDTDGARDSYSKRFLSGYQSQIIGEDLSGVNLSRIGGASLTTSAFNNALSSIKSQAS